MQTAAELQKLLQTTLENREADLIQQWRGSADKKEREQTWLALRELDLLAGAIENGIKQHSSD